jgi:exopolysaccharide production protein ExoQ
MGGSYSVNKSLPAGSRSRWRFDASPALDWCLCCASLTGLLFGQYLGTLALVVFTAMASIFIIRQSGRALIGLYEGGILWIFPALCFVSTLWSPVPGISVRGALEVALSTGVALAIGRGMPPRSLMTAFMCALLIATVASLLDARVALNAGALAMIGIFGSKNQFGLSQALLLIVCTWVSQDRSRDLYTRGLALIGLICASYLSLAARSVDSYAIAVGALGCAFVGFHLSWFPMRGRLLFLCLIVALVMVLFLFFFVIADEFDLFGHLLGAVGKDSTLTGRTEIWARAKLMMEENPILGTGFQGFWIEGNPYAEDIWHRFQPGRTGFNFHNLWYEIGVTFGYVGLAAVFSIVVLTSMKVIVWVVRLPSVASCFFFSFVVFADIRTFLESELLGQFSIPAFLFVLSWSYARQATRRPAPAAPVAALYTIPAGSQVRGFFGRKY